MADVVILSSDEEIEDERDTNSLFQDFLSKVEPFVDRTVVVLLSMKFDEARDAVGRSSSFRSLLQRKLRVVKRGDAYIHTAEICKELCKVAKKETAEPEPCKTTTDNKESLREVQNEPNECNGDSSDGARVTSSGAGKFENANKASTSQETLQDIVIVEVPGAIEIGKRNTAKPVSPQPTCSAKSSARAVLSPSKRKRVIKRLEQKMNVVADQIKILNRAELSLEEMAMSDSTYLKESRLKETFNKYWNKICALQGKPPNTGRVVEKEVKIPSTGYPAIDEDVNKFMKKRKNFPDIFDVKEVIERANKKHDLRISVPVLKEIAEEVFTNVGNRLQRRRKIDFTNNFGCSLTDDYDMSQDPAMHDLELQKKLERNHKKSKHALNKVFRKYVHYDRLKYQDSQDDGSGTGQSDYDNGKPSRRRIARKRVKSSSDSDSELNEDLSQSSQTKENSDSDDEGIQLSSHRTKSAKVKTNYQASDTSDFEDDSRISRSSTVEDPGDLDQEMASQGTASSSQPVEPQSSVENDPEKLGRNPKRSPQGHVSAAENVEEKASSPKSSPQHPGEPQRKDDNHHLANGAVDSEDNGVITIDDDVDDKLTEAIPNADPYNANLAASEQKEAVNIKNKKLDSEEKESCEVQKEAVATASNGDGSVVARPISCGSHATIHTAAKSASPLRGLVKLSSVHISKTLQNSADLVEAKTGQKKVGAVKRPADDDICYESPLKMFRKSTLEVLLEQGGSEKTVLGVGTNHGTSSNGQLLHNSCKSDSASWTSPEIAGENSTVSRSDETPRKSLSLKKKHTKKALNDQPVAVIVLSDDESD